MLNNRHKSPLHEYWWKRVEGQIRCCVKEHPEWFAGDTEVMKNSLAKRIVGEIVAACTVANNKG